MARPRACSICGELEKIGENSSGDSIYPRRSPERKPRKHWFSMEPVVGIEPTTYGLRIRRQFLDYAKTAANMHFIEMVEVRGLACLTCSTVAQCCAEAFDPARGFDKVPLWMIR